MPVNPYFNNFTATNEQDLMADLIVEAIKMYGFDMYYLPKTHTNLDDLYGQSDTSEFNSAYEIEMYIRSIDSFEGEGNFLSKFGWEVRDRVGLSVARRTFNELIGTPATLPRPREGDLLYFSMTKKLFEIIYVDNRAIFYPLGALPLFDLNCEVFEYNGEKFNTGVAEIDAIAENYTMDRIENANLAANGAIQYHANGEIITNVDFDEFLKDVEFDNNVIQAEANNILDYSEDDPFSEGGY
jgi:hypothetical protein